MVGALIEVLDEELETEVLDEELEIEVLDEELDDDEVLDDELELLLDEASV
jgi:hypothetical protein